jgi:hypothetical protein
MLSRVQQEAAVDRFIPNADSSTYPQWISELSTFDRDAIG